MVFAGAGLGGVARYALGVWIMSRYKGAFPLGTFAVNVSGSFVIGLLMALMLERFQPHPNLRLFLMVGVLGGYTTFSSFELEIFEAVRTGNRIMGPLYAAASVAAGFLAVWLGFALGAKRS
jgi:CrcB protein